MEQVRIQCPIVDFSCPYFNKGLCIMYDEDGVHPKDQCDDYMYYASDD